MLHLDWDFCDKDLKEVKKSSSPESAVHSDIFEIEEASLLQWSIREIKQLLVANNVDSSGCIDKMDLIAALEKSSNIRIIR